MRGQSMYLALNSQFGSNLHTLSLRGPHLLSHLHLQSVPMFTMAANTRIASAMACLPCMRPKISNKGGKASGRTAIRPFNFHKMLPMTYGSADAIRTQANRRTADGAQRCCQKRVRDRDACIGSLPQRETRLSCRTGSITSQMIQRTCS